MSRMIQKYKFVEKNIEMLKTLTKNGYVSPKLLNDYSIYKSYMSIKNPSKMKRYSVVAKENKRSVVNVRVSVRDMKSYVKV